MIPFAHPIKLIHVSAFDGSQSLWFRWITHASDYRSLQKRLQMPSGKPHCFRTTAQKWSAARIFTAVSALCLRSLPSSRHLAAPSGLSHHHSIIVAAPPCSLFDARAASAPLFAPARRIRPFLSHPPRPLSLRPRAASARFFVSRPPPLRTPCKSRCTHAPFFLDVFHVLPCFPPQPQPGCSLISFSFLEASTGLRWRPPPACGGSPGAVRVCFADHCFLLRTIRQR